MITDVGLKTDWLLLSKSCESWDIHLFFFYTVGEPGYAVLMRLIIWKSWPTYIVIHCCKKGEYVGTPIILFLPRSYFPDSRELILMATPFYIVPEKNVSYSWINYFWYHSSYYDYHMLMWLGWYITFQSIAEFRIGVRVTCHRKDHFLFIFLTKLYISLTLVISICNVARDGSSTREQTVTEWQGTSFKS